MGHQKYQSNFSKAGISLLELLVSVAILGVIAVVAASLFGQLNTLNKKFGMGHDDFNALLPRENFDERLMKEKKVLNAADKDERRRKICKLLDLGYSSALKQCTISVKRCGNGANYKMGEPCLSGAVDEGEVPVMKALCDLEKRARIPELKFCIDLLSPIP